MAILENGAFHAPQAEQLVYPTPGYPSREQLLNTGHVAIIGTDHEAMLAVHDALAMRGIAGYSVLSIPEEPATHPKTVPGYTQRDFRTAAVVEAGKAVLDVVSRAKTKAEAAAAASGESVSKKIDVPGRDVVDTEAIVAYRVATQESGYMNAIIEGAAAVVVTDVPPAEADELTRVEALIGWAEQQEKPVSRLRPGVPISPMHLIDLTARVKHYELQLTGKEYKFFIFDWLATRRRELRIARAGQSDDEEGRLPLAAGETTFRGAVKETLSRRAEAIKGYFTKSTHVDASGNVVKDENKVNPRREDKTGKLLR